MNSKNNLSLFIYIMKAQYIIQIGNQGNYPFDGVKQGCSLITVRNSFDFTPQTYFQVHAKIHTLMNIKSPIMMQIVKIIETKGKKIEVDYQYVSQALKNSPKMSEASFIPVLRQTLVLFYKILIAKGIKYQFKLDDIGITESGSLKIYIGLQFQLISSVQKQNLENQYQIMVQKMIESHFNFGQAIKSPSDNTLISDYSLRVNKKMQQLQDRLKQMRKYNKKSSFSVNRSCKNKHKEDNKDILLDLSPDKKISKQNTVATGLTSNSFIYHKNAEKVKIHKLSVGEYQTATYRLDDSSFKQSSLTKRISSALEKTQNAFKVYQKYSRKKSRKKS